MFTDLCSQDIWLHNGAKYPKHEYKIQTIWGNTSTHNPLKSPLKCIVSLSVAHENLKPALCAAYRADIFVLSSIVLSPAHELWKCLEVTKHSLQPRDSFTELRDVMDVCKSVCVYVCNYNSVCVNPFTTVLIKKKRYRLPLSSAFLLRHSAEAARPPQSLSFLPFSNMQLPQ